MMTEGEGYIPGPNELSEMVFGRDSAERHSPKDRFDILYGMYKQAEDRGNPEEIEYYDGLLSMLVESTPDLRSDPAFDQYRKD